MAKSKKVSIVVPIYNAEPYIERSIESIINQTYKNIEIILVDDGSEDGSGKICDKYAKKDKRIKVIHKENGGVSSARNTGIREAGSNYIVFVDSDDYVDENYIDLLLSEIVSQDADIAMMTHYIEYPNKKPTIRYEKEYIVLNSHDAIDRMLYDEGIDISPWGKIYKKELFSKIKYPEGKIFEDTATTPLLLMEADKIVINNQPTYHYLIQNNDSITNSVFSSSKMQLIDVTEEMCRKVLEKYPDLEKGTKRRIMFANIATLRQMVGVKAVNKQLKHKIELYIKENRKNTLKDKRTPKRDRIGVILASMGFGIFSAAWKITSKRRSL